MFWKKTSDGSWLQKQFLTPDLWSDGTGEWGWCDGDIQGDLIVINFSYFEFEPFNEPGMGMTLCFCQNTCK